jgi:tol-pal system protein YbgF
LKPLHVSRVVAIGLAFFVATPGPGAFAGERTAQLNVAPPGGIPGVEGDQGDEPAALMLRIDRLENQVRALNGALEQSQFQQRKLEEQLKRFQEDVEFRLTGARPAPATAPLVTATPPAAAPPPVAVIESIEPAKPAKRSDVFDPNADPNAPGAPRQIGSTPPSAPLGAPLELSRNAPQPPPGGDTPMVIQGVGPAPAPPTAPDAPRDQLNAALEAYRAGQYESSEAQLKAFLARNGGSRLAPDAIFYLGETYFQRSRPREAAEQYLKLSTDFAKSTRAPEGMLRLGQSLAALGNNDQACATFGEAGRRYPTMSPTVKKNVDREMQKDHC